MSSHAIIEYIYTSTSAAELGLVMNYTQVNSTDSMTIMGVIVGNKLNFNDHIYTLYGCLSVNHHWIHQKIFREELLDLSFATMTCYVNLHTAASVPGIGIDLLRNLVVKDFKCVSGLNTDYFNKMIHKNRVLMSYATHPFCPDLKLIIFTTVSKFSLAIGPKCGILHCLFHWNWNLCMNSNTW